MKFWKPFVWFVPVVKTYKSEGRVEKHARKMQFTAGKSSSVGTVSLASESVISNQHLYEKWCNLLQDNGKVALPISESFIAKLFSIAGLCPSVAQI